jgi:WD40 repeat protein
VLVKEIQLDTQTGTSYTLDWSQDGEILAAGSGYEITLLGKDLDAKPVVIKPEVGALAVALSPSGDQLATVNGYRNTDITIWDLEKNSGQLTQVRQLDGGSDQYGVSWSPDGRLLATLGDDDKTTIQIWDTTTWEQVHRYELTYAYPRRALNWSRDSAILYEAGEADGQAVVFALDVNDGTVKELGKFSTDELYAFAISPDALTLAIADEHGVIRFVDLDSGGRIVDIKTVDQPVDLVWHPDGKRLAILGYKSALQLWFASQ